MLTTQRILTASSVLVFGLLSACASDQQASVETRASVPTAARAVPPVTARQIVPGSIEDFRQNVGDRVTFDYERYELDEQDREVLRRQAAWLTQYPAVTLTVEGHADERGTREYNLALGARRAAAVREYLTSLGVSASRLETMSYGKERPNCTVSNETCWSQNRRGQSTIRSGALS